MSSMAKQVIASVLEEIVGEYFLNIKKENVKIAALRGKVKLENVQLDGDLIGSHILGLVGLSGFAVLSCWASSVRVVVPWTNLEREPTRFEIRDVHLVCIPLLQTTSSIITGSGTLVDPRCTLATKAKRSTLARFERNYFSGRIPGEGPPRRIFRRNAREEQQTHARQRRRSKSKDSSESNNCSDKEDWKAKLRAKVVRNIEISVRGCHLRCEIPRSSDDSRTEDSFAFGLTLDSFVIKSQGDESKPSSEESSDPDFRSGDSRRLLELNNLSIYWDNEPPLFVSDSNLLRTQQQGLTPDKVCLRIAEAMESLSSQQEPGSAIRTSLSIGAPSSDATDSVNSELSLGRHEFLLQNFSTQLLFDASFDNGVFGFSADVLPFPLNLKIAPHQYRQYRRLRNGMLSQQRLDTMLRQRPKSSPLQKPKYWWKYVISCVTTRPTSRPWEDVRVICESRTRYLQLVEYKILRAENGNGFHAGLTESESTDLLHLESLLPIEVLLAFHLLASRNAYKTMASREDHRTARSLTPTRNGRVRTPTRRGLFRRVSSAEDDSDDNSQTESPVGQSPNKFPVRTPTRKGSSLKLFRRSSSAGDESDDNSQKESPVGQHQPKIPIRTPTRKGSFKLFRRPSIAGDESDDNAQKQTLVEQSRRRENQVILPVNSADSVEVAVETRPANWKVTLRDARIQVVLVDAMRRMPIVKLEMRLGGKVRSSGDRHREVDFDVTQFELLDSVNRDQSSSRFQAEMQGRLLEVKPSPPSVIEEEVYLDSPFLSHRKKVAPNTKVLKSQVRGKETSESEDKPHSLPLGVVSHVYASLNPCHVEFSISAHPATLLWSKPCVDAIITFFAMKSVEPHKELFRQLRSAATPLARKAQLALLSPAKLNINIDVAAPKVWIPITSDSKDGALFLDSGRFKLAFYKKEKSTDTRWEATARDMRVNFMDPNSKQPYSSKNSWNEGTPILFPFQIELVSCLRESLDHCDGLPELTDSPSEQRQWPLRTIVANVSSICLNLLDVEILARSIGKWYANGLVRARQREAAQATEQSRKSKSVNRLAVTRSNVVSSKPDALPAISRLVVIRFESVEMALQGHSKGSNTKNADLLTDTKHSARSTRTYLVEVRDISLTRERVRCKTRLSMTVSDASVVQLDGNRASSIDQSSVQPQHLVLMRENRGLDYISTKTATVGSSSTKDTASRAESIILFASYVRDSSLHNDEVEVEMDSVVLRITPTSMKDCLKCCRRLFELAELMTKEMERNVHREGRIARQSTGPEGPVEDRQNGEVAIEKVDVSGSEQSESRIPSDSSILIKVVLRESYILAGVPTQTNGSSTNQTSAISYSVVQLLSNALIMFQSIENPDASGRRTLHISSDKTSASVNSEFRKVEASHVSPMIDPTAVEFRIVYATECSGFIVSQDLSFDCERIKSSLTPDDVSVLGRVLVGMSHRLRADEGEKRGDQRLESEVRRKNSVSPGQIASKQNRRSNKGRSVITRIRAEILSFSCVLLRPFQTSKGIATLFDLSVSDLKGRLEGCISALAGECAGTLSLQFFRSDSGEVEYTIEPQIFTAVIDQMPNETILSVSTENAVQLNITGALLRDVDEFSRDIRRRNELEDKRKTRGKDSPSVFVKNDSGLPLILYPSKGVDVSIQTDCIIVGSGSETSLDSLFGKDLSLLVSRSSPALDIGLAPSDESMEHVGPRKMLVGLPICPATDCSDSLHLLLSQLSPDTERRYNEAYSPRDDLSGISDLKNPDHFCFLEPVVEMCMQNQRLRPSTFDVLSIDKGRDLLSSTIWSPEDILVSETRQPSSRSLDGVALLTSSHHTELKGTKEAPLGPSRHSEDLYWLSPYLEDDTPEWTDMTGCVSMQLQNVLLPDDNWIWLNEWTVDRSGKYGEATDADGWEYEADFETFTRRRRFYKRGDACRRRKWTRTRMAKRSHEDNILRPLFVSWDRSQADSGDIRLVVRSHVFLHNCTDSSLVFFAFCPSWDEDKFVGRGEPGDDVPLPLHLASAVFLRIGMSSISAEVKDGKAKFNMEDCSVSDRILIVPTGHTSKDLLRTTISISDASGKTLSGTEERHFVVRILSKRGSVDVFIQPVFRIVNLLPCEVLCNFGQTNKLGEFNKSESTVSSVETLRILSADEGKCTSVAPESKPHVSFRVPGYKWSSWNRIVNRDALLNTWRPSDEEDLRAEGSQSWDDRDREFKSFVKFQRIGKGRDPLTVVMSVEVGHCPILRIYAQYWILDKTGFGCWFSEGFSDLLGLSPDAESSRRSHLLAEEKSNPAIKKDISSMQGYEWSLGMSGMSLFFSRKETITLCIENSKRVTGNDYANPLTSKWLSPIDISNVIPKTVFSLDESGGANRFELAMSVTICPSAFGRTKLITLFPRYQITNLLGRDLFISQNGAAGRETRIRPTSTVSFHWKDNALPPKVKLGLSQMGTICWTTGRIALGKIGFTAMRLPTKNSTSQQPVVLQADVRLASKDQACAVTLVVSETGARSKPLYLLRNRTTKTILCRQPLQDDGGEKELRRRSRESNGVDGSILGNDVFECGGDLRPIIDSFLGLDHKEEFTWALKSGQVSCFGFDDPEKPHILEWTYASGVSQRFYEKRRRAFLEIDAMGSWSSLSLKSGHEVRCCLFAEHSTKVIEFIERIPDGKVADRSADDLLMIHNNDSDFKMMGFFPANRDFFPEKSNGSMWDDEADSSLALRFILPVVSISIIDNESRNAQGREILLAELEGIRLDFSHNREGYQELELKVMSMQIDNHVHRSVHPVMIFCPRIEESQPVLHLSAVRRLQPQSSTLIFRYAALRILEIDVSLDRRTAETLARFTQPLRRVNTQDGENPSSWVSDFTSSARKEHTVGTSTMSTSSISSNAISERIYFEQLHLHPLRIGLTFTQDWTSRGNSNEGMMVFQFVRGMASIANAPLTFTSFVVSHAFESREALLRILFSHYASQLTKQLFGIIGSLAILEAPADFISNVGTGVRDFFYEPINGMVHGPEQFIEGLEAGTQSLARGVFVGVVRGAANVTEVVNSNLADLTADDNFISERKAHQRMILDAMSRDGSQRSLSDSLYLAAASFARGVKSGALGIVEQPSIYASKHGPLGLAKGVGKAFVGAIVKPVVGFGDASVLIMDHVSELTGSKRVTAKIQKRLRRALPFRSRDSPHSVRLIPYDERAAKAQKIVTGGESVNDIYVGHVNLSSHLFIASDQCLWVIDRRSREPWCINWEEISHFERKHGIALEVTAFSPRGLEPHLFQVETSSKLDELYELLAMQSERMGNCSLKQTGTSSSERNGLQSKPKIVGVKTSQKDYMFGTCNMTQTSAATTFKDEMDIIEKACARVNLMGSESPTFFRKLDEEAWGLVGCYGNLFSGLSSRRCVVVGVVNGTGHGIQIKSKRLVEGGSPCYSIPSKEFDQELNVLHAGGAILFFGWGALPSLLQGGNVFMSIETNAFVGDFTHYKSRATNAVSQLGYHVRFLEKSYDENGWWAKYWILVCKT